MDYKISVEKTSDVDRAVTIDVPRGLYEDRFSRKLNSVASRANIKGFRRGRAPRTIVQKLYGDEIRSDVLSEICREGYREAVTQHSLQVIGAPQIDVPEVSESADQDIRIVAKVSVLPDPELKSYKGLSFSVANAEVNEEAIETAIAQACEPHATVADITDRVRAAADDVIVADIHSRVEEDEKTDSHHHDLAVDLKRDRLPEGFREKVTGATIDHEIEFDLTLPDDMEEAELAGKSVHYKVKVKKIQAKSFPELTDEFVKTNKFGETADAFRADVRKRLETEVTRGNKERTEQKLAQALVEANPFEVPQALIDEEIRESLFRMGVLKREDERAHYMDVGRFRSVLGPQAEQRARFEVLLRKVVELEGLEFAEGDEDAYIRDNFMNGDSPDEPEVQFERLKKSLLSNSKSGEISDGLKHVITRGKAVKSLIDSAKIDATAEKA